MLCACSELCLRSYLFFCSSRRRHTSLVSDWSSDVCSSDLDSALGAAVPSGSFRNALWHAGQRSRSEERRVGKECRSRGSADRDKISEHVVENDFKIGDCCTGIIHICRFIESAGICLRLTSG